MKTGRLLLLASLAVGCGKKAEPTPLADASPKEAAKSCLHAQNARAYVWKNEPLELALEVDLDWTCPKLADDKLELTDTEMGAKLGEQKVKERYRLDKTGALADWEDPFLYDQTRVRGLFLYSVSTKPSAVALWYGGVQILASVTVGADAPPRRPAPSMRVLSTSVEPGGEKGKNRVTAVLELTDMPRSAGRSWRVGGAFISRTFGFEMTGEDRGSTIDAEWVHADRVLEVDEKLTPLDTPLPLLPARPAKRLVLAEVSATKMLRLKGVSVSFGIGMATATAEGAPKLVLAKDTRARLDAAPPSTDVDARKL